MITALLGKKLGMSQYIYDDGRMEKAITVSKTSGERASGFPKMNRKDKDLLFAWTSVDENMKVKTTMVKLSDN